MASKLDEFNDYRTKMNEALASNGNKCHDNGLSTEELMEIFAIPNLVGSSIVIPHTRRAIQFWEDLPERDSV